VATFAQRATRSNSSRRFCSRARTHECERGRGCGWQHGELTRESCDEYPAAGLHREEPRRLFAPQNDTRCESDSRACRSAPRALPDHRRHALAERGGAFCCHGTIEQDKGPNGPRGGNPHRSNTAGHGKCYRNNSEAEIKSFEGFAGVASMCDVATGGTAPAPTKFAVFDHNGRKAIPRRYPTQLFRHRSFSGQTLPKRQSQLNIKAARKGPQGQVHCPFTAHPCQQQITAQNT